MHLHCRRTFPRATHTELREHNLINVHFIYENGLTTGSPTLFSSIGLNLHDTVEHSTPQPKPYYWNCLLRQRRSCGNPGKNVVLFLFSDCPAGYLAQDQAQDIFIYKTTELVPHDGTIITIKPNILSTPIRVRKHISG